jgi:hypothetical protein
MHLAMDAQAWFSGFEDGEQGKRLDSCPYGSLPSVLDQRLHLGQGCAERLHPR